MVATEDDVAGFVANVPVIPAGQLDTARVTAELKPLAGVTVIVEVPLDPTIADVATAPKVKVGAALTVNEIVVLADKPPPAPVTTSEYGPGVTPALTLMVAVEDEVVGFDANEPV